MEIDPKEFSTIGAGIIRPEGVVVQRDGTVLTTDARGQIARISADGKTSFYGDVGGTPNGICLDGEGNCIIASKYSACFQIFKNSSGHESKNLIKEEA